MVALGPSFEREAPVVGHGQAGGLAVWRPAASLLSLQALASDGSPRGPVSTLSLDPAERQQPRLVYGLEAGFLVLLRRWDWQSQDVRWWGLAVDLGGRPRGRLTDLALAGMDVHLGELGQVLDAERVGLLVSAVPGTKQPGRWQTLTVSPEGSVTSTPTALSFDDVITTPRTTWEPAVLAGRRGWVVVRAGVRDPEGFFEGGRGPAREATLLRPPDAIDARVHNAAVPPPPGPGGTTIEAMLVPVLVRSRQGVEVGSRLRLEVQGKGVGIEGLSVRPDLVWTGTHFLYPFGGSSGPGLLPIRCQKPSGP